MAKKLSAEERMKLLCEKSLPFMTGMLDQVETQPGRHFATLGIPDDDRVQGLLEVGREGDRWYLLAGAIPRGTDRLYSQYLKHGTKEEIRAYLTAAGSPRELEAALRELIRRAES